MFCDECQTSGFGEAQFCTCCGRRLMPSVLQGGLSASWAGEMTHTVGLSGDEEQQADESAVDAERVDPFRTGMMTAAADATFEPGTQAATLTVAGSLCESCGMSAVPGSTLCESCQRSFAEVLQPATGWSGREAVERDEASEAVTIVSAPPAPAGVPSEIVSSLTPGAFAPADGLTTIDTRIEETIGADVLPTIQPAIAAAELAEPRPWWERQYDDVADVPLAEPAFVPRGPATPPAVSAAPASTYAPADASAYAPSASTYASPPAYLPAYVPPPATPHGSVAYGHGTTPVEASNRRNVAPRAPKPLPMAPPPVRKGRGALISGAIVLACAAVGAPLAWSWSKLGLGKANTVAAAIPRGEDTAVPAPPRERPRSRPVTVYGSARAPRPAPRSAAKAPVAAAPKPRRPAPVKAPPAMPVPQAPILSASAVSTAFVPAVASAPAPPPPPPPQEDISPAGPTFDVAQVDMRPEIKSRVEAVIPAHLSARRVEDVVVLRVLVSPGGAPSEIRVLRRARVDASLDAAAIAAVRQWRFVPARKKGQAVRCWYNIGVPFNSAGE